MKKRKKNLAKKEIIFLKNQKEKYHDKIIKKQKNKIVLKMKK